MISSYIRFVVKNPIFSIYAFAFKCLLVRLVYDEIKEKMRGTGEALASATQ
ncbi:MAG: hypothetical protein RLZZ203_2284 [Cyanobacteriota bacterium]|jgi:hypothetical protein